MPAVLDDGDEPSVSSAYQWGEDDEDVGLWAWAVGNGPVVACQPERVVGLLGEVARGVQ